MWAWAPLCHMNGTWLLTPHGEEQAGSLWGLSHPTSTSQQPQWGEVLGDFPCLTQQ